MLVGFNYAPTNFALCQGQLLAIASNTALYSLLGTYYGGDGRSTFGLPDLRGCTGVGMGQAKTGTQYSMGDKSGSETVTLLSGQVPPHTHTISAAHATSSDQSSPAGNGLGPASLYSNSQANLTPLNASAVSMVGQNMPHNNLMPYLTLNWIICLNGIYPPRG